MQRPLSPHLQIYSPQLTSVLSILHRLTGLGFTVGLILTCAWLFALSVGPVEYNNFCGWLIQPFVKTIIYLILASIYYHMLNGIRYLVWSLGKGFELSSVYYSGWIVCSLIVVLTVLTVFFIWNLILVSLFYNGSQPAYYWPWSLGFFGIYFV